MIGKTFGKLRVVELARRGTRGLSWWCICECGTRLRLSTFQLNNGEWKTCGCSKTWHDKVVHGPTELRREHQLTFVSWKAVMARCYYAKDNEYYSKVQVCERWFTFANFLTDMGDRPALDYSIDRVDPDKGYYKENCQWITKAENCAKARKNMTPERNALVSAGLRTAHAEGRIVVSTETRQAIAAGAKKRVGRTLQTCTQCGEKSYLPLCQRCRGERPAKGLYGK